MLMGYSRAGLERLLDEGLIVAMSRGASLMTRQDIAEAKLGSELGLKTSGVTYTDEERRRVATHEAGHATVAYLVGEGRQLDVLSIAKRRDSLGLLQHSSAEERFTLTKPEALALLRISMGGLAAEELFFNGVASSGPAGDLAGATQLGAQMVGAFGMGNSLISVATAESGPLGGDLVARVLGDEQLRAELDRLLHEAHDDARLLLEEHRPVTEALRDALLERDELIGEQILGVIHGAQGSPSGFLRVASEPRATNPVAQG
jgi:cell division protease FtsH